MLQQTFIVKCLSGIFPVYVQMHLHHNIHEKLMGKSDKDME